MQLRTTDKEQVWHQSQNVEVRVKDFGQTVSDRSSTLRQMSTTVAPGTYELALQVLDEESKKNLQINRTVRVPDFERDSLSISDILLVNRMSGDGPRKTIVPNISSSFGEKTENFYLFFEVYRRGIRDSVRLRFRLLDAKQAEIFSEVRREALTGNLSQLFWKVESATLGAGQYVAAMEVLPPAVADSMHVLARSIRAFSVRWHDLPPTITNLDKAVEQLRYVAKDAELDYIREAKDPEEKKRRFVEFWDKHDPDPQTPRNELMEEYYARVAYANKNYSHYVEGWKTDMGMVYITFGPPESIERHPFELSTRPYEVWYYYQQNREFVFVDETGFGDYRLRYPTTDLWGRLR